MLICYSNLWLTFKCSIYRKNVVYLIHFISKWNANQCVEIIVPRSKSPGSGVEPESHPCLWDISISTIIYHNLTSFSVMAKLASHHAEDQSVVLDVISCSMTHTTLTHLNVSSLSAMYPGYPAPIQTQPQSTRGQSFGYYPPPHPHDCPKHPIVYSQPPQVGDKLHPSITSLFKAHISTVYVVNSSYLNQHAHI